MGTIGNWLRQVRETQGLSLEEVQQITKIRTRYLEAIESEDFSKLPGEAYTRAFIRTYAVGIGMKPDEVMSRYHELYDKPAITQVVTAPVSRPRRLVHGLFTTLNGTMEWLGL